LLLTAAFWPALIRADSTAGDYHAPDFDAQLFDRDALSLEGKDLTDVVDALTAVVRNFESVPNIDSDVKEKALALALRLQPLNPAARSAHQLMLGGQEPLVGYESILNYSDTTKIFQVLAVQGERLLRERAQPDDEILGPLLMEIGLTVLAAAEWEDPEVQILAHAFSAVGGEGELAGFWKMTVRLQPVAGDGASVLASRMANLKPIEVIESSVAPPGAEPSSPAMPTTGAEQSTDPVGEYLAAASVMFVTDVLGSGGASLADALIEIVDSDPDEINESGREPTTSIRLVRSGPTNSALRGVTGGKAWVNQSFSQWPDGKQAVIRFLLGHEDEAAEVAAPGERWPVEVGLPVAMVMHAALSNTQLAADVAVSGRIESSGTIRPVLPRAEVLREVAENVDRIAVLATAPDEAVDPGLSTTPSEIEALGRVQVIEVESFDELRRVTVRELRPPELREAMNVFAEAQRVGIRAGNLSDSTMREKFAATLELWPGHYSAQRLLAASALAAVDSPSTTSGEAAPAK